MSPSELGFTQRIQQQSDEPSTEVKALRFDDEVEGPRVTKSVATDETALWGAWELWCDLSPSTRGSGPGGRSPHQKREAAGWTWLDDVKSIGVFDTADNSFDASVSTGALTMTHKFNGAAAVGTKVVFAPYYADVVGVYDVAAGTFDASVSTGALTTNGKFIGAAAVGFPGLVGAANMAGRTTWGPASDALGVGHNARRGLQARGKQLVLAAERVRVAYSRCPSPGPARRRSAGGSSRAHWAERDACL